MRTATRLDYNTRMAEVIERILRSDNAPVGVAELAEELGFSRFHLTRFFLALTGESLSDFLRRIQLERVAYLLHHTDLPIQQLAFMSGYSSGEALTRAFRQMFSVPPSDFRARKDLDWKIACPSDLHWVPELGLLRPGVRSEKFDVKLVSLAPMTVAVVRVVKNYAKLNEAFEELAEMLRSQGMEPPDTQYVTIYHDSMWTIPEASQMRADIGFVVSADEPVPSGLKLLTVPAGKYAVSSFIDRADRNDGWIHMDAAWSPLKDPAVKKFVFDLYPRLPVPFETIQTKMCARIGR